MTIRELSYSVGDEVTVLEWHERTSDLDGRKFKDQSYVGDHLTVLAIDYPFIVVRRRNHFSKDSITIDTRKLVLKKLSKEFVKAITEKDES